ASKVFVLSWIGFLQSAFLTLTVGLVCDLPGDLPAYVGISLLLSLLGTSMGLAISANSKSEELSVALVPAAIIPQIILAGVVANLSGVSDLLANAVTTSYWGQQLFENFIPKSDQCLDDSRPSVFLCFAVLISHLAVFQAGTWFGCRFMRFSPE
ncbi:MAG: ABC transporter permease, partial [Planctomycetota bacterium]